MSKSRFGEDMKLKRMEQADYPGGLVVDPVPITFGEEITVLYYGLVGRPESEGVTLHLGYGAHNRWHNVADLPMERTGHGWAKVFKTTYPDRLNLCFRDAAGNWDNNNGKNWSFEVHNGETN